jgi:cyclopropane-fatty-acyl-phospholipid synthase
MSHANENVAVTVATPKSLWQRILCQWADRITTGQLTLYFPGGQHYHCKGMIGGPAAVLHIHSGKIVWRLLSGGALGLAEAYIDGEWDSPDLGAVLRLGLANEDAFGAVLVESPLVKVIAYLRHRLNANTRTGSRRNIAAHYDLGNDFYGQWLDGTMTYSAALFTRDGQSLEDAQQAKYDRVLAQLDIGADDHVLEIGCGWGGFAEHAARKTGCRVTGLTLSTEQAEFARARLAASGLSDKTEIRLQDYRDCDGQFSKIVSIEMFEAVGEENWPTYFATLQKRLAPQGRALLQSITIAADHFRQYRRNADFIQTYIFPGGMLPSPEAFEAAANAGGLKIANKKFFGPDYATTLKHWDISFRAAWSRIEKPGFDQRFKRMWHYYLQYCIAGFVGGRTDVGQFLLERA